MFDPAFARPGRFYKGNLHTHSNRSDGLHTPEHVADLYRDRGYDFLALTDHFLAKYAFPIVDTQPFRTDGFTTILGAEVHAPKTAIGEIWHILAVGLPLDFAPTGETETGPELAERWIAAGAFVSIAHPAWYALSMEDVATLPNAHAVEIYNHTCEVRTNRGDSSALIDQMLATGRQTLVIATDDAHFKCEDAFGGYVMVKAEANDPDLLLAALKAGAFYASQAPLIHDVQFDAEAGTVRVSSSPARAVMALGIGASAKQALGEDLTETTFDLSGLKERGGFVRIVVIDANGRRAWTNPIRL